MPHATPPRPPISRHHPRRPPVHGRHGHRRCRFTSASSSLVIPPQALESPLRWTRRSTESRTRRSCGARWTRGWRRWRGWRLRYSAMPEGRTLSCMHAQLFEKRVGSLVVALHSFLAFSCFGVPLLGVSVRPCMPTARVPSRKHYPAKGAFNATLLPFQCRHKHAVRPFNEPCRDTKAA